MTTYSRNLFIFCSSLSFLLFFGCTAPMYHTKQQKVHHMGHEVMPFDLSKTIHIFRMTDFGGVQRVIVKDAATMDQVPLIQQHLQKEAKAFQHGDYSDPASLHGIDMPGLKELQAGALHIKVTYSALPNGATITFKHLTCNY